MAVDISTLLIVSATILTSIMFVMSGVVAWIVKKVFELKTSDIPESESRINSLEEQFRGAPGSDEGFAHSTSEEIEDIENKLDCIESMLEDAEDMRRRNHAEVNSAIGDIIYVLEDHGFNGDLPNRDQFDPPYYNDNE